MSSVDCFRLLTLLCCGTHVTALSQQTGRETTPKLVPYCQVVGHSRLYDGQILRLDAIYRQGGEIMSSYSLSCPQAEQSSWVDESDDLRRRTTPALLKRMEQILDAQGRVRIVAVVKFSGPKKVEIPLGTSPELADVMRAINSRYGHMNQFNTRVLLLEILQVEPVAANAPWPH